MISFFKLTYVSVKLLPPMYLFFPPICTRRLISKNLQCKFNRGSACKCQSFNSNFTIKTLGEKAIISSSQVLSLAHDSLKTRASDQP